jgi:Xaa-Pro aminopeptidase
MPDPMTEEFARRRRQLMRLMGRDAIAVLPAAPERTRNNDVYYNYRQDSDFHYLTGFAEPDSVAVLMPGRPQGEFVMFVRDRNDEREIWDGRRAGPAGARRRYGATPGPTTPSRSATWTTSCPACSRAGRGSTTPWASTTTLTSAWWAG